MSDRFIVGVIAGAVGSILQAVYGYTGKSLGYTDRTFCDFGKAFIMFLPYKGLFADFVGLLSHVGNGIFFGIVFAYLILWTSSKYCLLKGAIYGMTLWHLFFGIGTAFKMPMFHQIPPQSAFFTLIGSLIYGLVTAYTLSLLEKKTGLI